MVAGSDSAIAVSPPPRGALYRTCRHQINCATSHVREQELEVVAGQSAGKTAFAEDVAHQGGLALLQIPDFLFDSAAADQPVGDHGAVLANAVGAVDGLCFDGWIPPRIEEHDVRRCGEIEPSAPGFERDEKYAGLRIVLERRDDLLAPDGLTGEAVVFETARPQRRREQIQTADELREDQHFVSFGEQRLEELEEGVELAGIELGAPARQSRM